MHITLKDGTLFRLCLVVQGMVGLVDMALWLAFRHLQRCHHTITEYLQCLGVHPDHRPMDLRMFRMVDPIP
jgi:ribosomal protein S18 acetylase RimI-like enzyme